MPTFVGSMEEQKWLNEQLSLDEITPAIYLLYTAQWLRAKIWRDKSRKAVGRQIVQLNKVIDYIISDDIY